MRSTPTKTPKQGERRSRRGAAHAAPYPALCTRLPIRLGAWTVAIPSAPRVQVRFGQEDCGAVEAAAAAMPISFSSGAANETRPAPAPLWRQKTQSSLGNARKSVFVGVSKVFAEKGRPLAAAETRDFSTPQRRHLPAQAGTFNDRRDAEALARLESESAEHVIEQGLWRYHRLLPPVSDSERALLFQQVLDAMLYYNALWLPLRCTFFASRKGTGWGGGGHALAWNVLDGLDVVIDLCFWLDIVVSSRTAYYDHTKELITDDHQILKRYFSGWFLLDLLPTIPWDYMLSSVLAKILRLGRCFRLLKIKRVRHGAQAQWARMLRIIVSAHGRAPPIEPCACAGVHADAPGAQHSDVCDARASPNTVSPSHLSLSSHLQLHICTTR